MLNLSLMIFLSTVVCSMTNGFIADQRAFGYIVSVVKDRYHLCSGIIIDETHVLTIAHAITAISLTNLAVIGGKSLFSAFRTTSNAVRGVHIHPGFHMRYSGLQYAYYENDIALLRLSQKFSWTPQLSPAPLGNPEFTEDTCVSCVLLSWAVPDDRRRQMVLTWNFIKFLNDDVNQAMTTYIGEHGRFFMDFFETALINEVDLGSPIVCGNITWGLVAQGEHYELPGNPSVMIYIAPYLEFIEETINHGLFNVEPSKYPYIASIWSGTTYVCGGFIVDDSHVATAGHCVAGDEAMNYTVAVAPSGTLIQWLSIAAIKIHPAYKHEANYQSSTWYSDHDFAILTLGEIIVWSEGALPLTLPVLDHFHDGQICELLRWKVDRDEITGVDSIKLMKSRVVLASECLQRLQSSSTQFDKLSFWGRSQYLMPIANSKDAGNPIICDDHPVGFFIQAVTLHGSIYTEAAKFLKLRPYMEFTGDILN